MKPQPRRRTAPVIPKAAAADPATMNASLRNNAGVETNASVRSDAGVETNASVRSDAGGPAARPTTKKLTLRLDEDDIGRIRAAWINDLARGGRSPSLNAWLAALIMDHVEAAEQASGERYAPIPAGQIPTGRPRTL